MKKLWVLISLALLGSPAYSLSCLPSDVVRTYNQAAQSSAEYLVVSGVLSFDKAKLPKTNFGNNNAARPDNWIKASMVGHYLTKSGFNRPFSHSIRLNARCFGPWCAQPSSGEPYLAFLEKTKSGYILVDGPCDEFAFALPTQKALDQVVSCFQGRTCIEKKW